MKTTVGASQVAALFHCSPWQSEYGLWCEFAGLTERQPDTPRLRMGRALEGAILAEWARDRGFLMIKRNTETFTSGECSATPDGIICDSVGMPSGDLVEVKTVEPARRHDWDNGAPLYYVLQCQQQMLVRGDRRVFLVAQFGFHSEPAEQIIAADEEVQAEIVRRVGIFMQRVRGELPPPEIDGHDATTAAIKSQKSVTDSRPLGGEAMEWTIEVETLAAQMKPIVARDKELRNKIRASLSGARVGVFPDGSSWRLIDMPESTSTRKAHTQMRRIKSVGAEDGE